MVTEVYCYVVNSYTCFKYTDKLSVLSSVLLVRTNCSFGWPWPLISGHWKKSKYTSQGVLFQWNYNHLPLMPITTQCHYCTLPAVSSCRQLSPKYLSAGWDMSSFYDISFVFFRKPAGGPLGFCAGPEGICLPHTGSTGGITLTQRALPGFAGFAVIEMVS